MFSSSLDDKDHAFLQWIIKNKKMSIYEDKEMVCSPSTQWSHTALKFYSWECNYVCSWLQWNIAAVVFHFSLHIKSIVLQKVLLFM